MNRYLVIFIFIFELDAQAASFDCKKASTKIEKLICTNQELSELDEILAQSYKKTLENGDRVPIIIDQKNWLKNERASCKETNCLIQSYSDRITTLQTWHNYTSPYEDLNGNYVITRDTAVVSDDTWVTEKTNDCLSLRKISPKEIEFEFTLIQTNGHGCGMEGIATLENNALVFNDKEFECKLIIKFKTRTIELESQNCSGYYCGSRAGIGGMEFLRTSRTPVNCEP